MTEVTSFQRYIQDYYRRHGRYDLPWRQAEADGNFDAYKILVSEIMLQQTQVGRVTPKFQQFVGQFPTLADVARAPLGEVLRAWSGLGYNRRAKFLQQAAQTVMRNYGGTLPHTPKELVALPGVGPNTAGAISVYAFNRPAVFVETNVRTVFIHHFFAKQTVVSDREIAALVTKTLPATDPRSWYWALMDYGAYLKQTVGNLNQVSRSYAKQSRFSGSRRQLRGQVIRLLGARVYGIAELTAALPDERLPAILDELSSEGLIRRSQNSIHL